jgi:hypothetical protein
MMEAAQILERAHMMGISLAAEAGCIAARPKGRTSLELAAAIRAHKRELLALLQVRQEQVAADRFAHANAGNFSEQDRAHGLALLNRLKTITVPAGRIPAARQIAERCAAQVLRWKDGEPVFEREDLASILSVLRKIEGELIALGGAPDADLAEAMSMVRRTFPGTRLVKVGKRRAK